MASWIDKLKASGKHLDTMDQLFIHELEDLYSAEDQIIHALPKMIDAASSPQLRQALQQHLETTKRQKGRLDECFRMIGRKPEKEKCKGMEGIIDEGAEVLAIDGDPEVKDAAIVAAAQRVEHYEIASYGSARNFAQRVGRADVADVLQQTLNEEGDTDHRLTSIAESSVNPQASRHRGTSRE